MLISLFEMVNFGQNSIVDSYKFLNANINKTHQSTYTWKQKQNAEEVNEMERKYRSKVFAKPCLTNTGLIFILFWLVS